VRDAEIVANARPGRPVRAEPRWAGPGAGQREHPSNAA